MALSKIGYHNIIINTSTGVGTEATIAVYDAGTSDLSTIYSDADGTAKGNSFSTDSVGRFSFFADPGEYDIKVLGSGITEYTLEGVSIIGNYERFVISEPSSGEYRLKKLRLDASLNMLVTHNDTVES